MSILKTIFAPNPKGAAMMAATFGKVSAQNRRDAYRVLRVGAMEYKRRIERVVPVDTGMLRRSWHMVSATTPKGFWVEVGTSIKSQHGVEYPVLLELGTKRIAGGRVLAWKIGAPAIMEWPAKMKRLAAGKSKAASAKKGGGKKFAKDSASMDERMKKAMAPGLGEQMPFVRPVGHDIAPRIVAAMWRAVKHGLQDGLNRKKF